MSSQPSLTTTNTYMYPRPHSRVHSRLHTVHFLMLIPTDKNAHSKRIFANSGTHTVTHTTAYPKHVQFLSLGKKPRHISVYKFLYTTRILRYTRLYSERAQNGKCHGIKFKGLLQSRWFSRASMLYVFHGEA